MSLTKVPSLKTITIQNLGNVPLEAEFSKTFPNLLQNLKKSVICRETPEKKNRP